MPGAVLRLVELPVDSEAPARLDIIAGDAKASLEISGWSLAMLVVTGSTIIERRGCGPIRPEDLDAFNTARSLIDDVTSADFPTMTDPPERSSGDGDGAAGHGGVV